MIKFNDLMITPEYDFTVNAEIIDTEDNVDSYVNYLYIHTDKTWDGDIENGDAIYQKELVNYWWQMDGNDSTENPQSVAQLLHKMTLPPPFLLPSIQYIKCCILGSPVGKIVTLNEGVKLNLAGMPEEDFKKITSKINKNKAITISIDIHNYSTTKVFKYYYKGEFPVPHFKYFTDPNATKKVSLTIKKEELDITDYNNLYYISVTETPYNKNSATKVIYNSFPIFKKNMKYIKELDSKCNIPKVFIDNILKLEAIDTAIEAKDYIFATKLWNTYDINNCE